MRNLRDPFRFHVLVRGLADHRKANQKNICLRVGKGPKSVVIFLSCDWWVKDGKEEKGVGGLERMKTSFK